MVKGVRSTQNVPKSHWLNLDRRHDPGDPAGIRAVSPLSEIVEEVEETVKEYEDGQPVYKKQRSQKKVVDDNTLQIAQAFRSWLSEQD